MPRLMTQLIERIHSFILRTKGSRSAVLLVVFYTNMLDNLLLTSVVPIIPEILIELDKHSLQNSLDTSKGNATNSENGSMAILAVEDDINKVNVSELGFAKRILQVSFSAVDENSKVGWLLSSKALVQLFANPVVGSLCNRCGYSAILCTGTGILLLSSFVYTMCGSFPPLLAARCIQGIGSAACTIAGMSLLADRYPDDRERSQVMGIAMGGTALGVVIGYPFGGFLYAYAGKLMPFALLSSFIIVDVAIQLSILNTPLSEKVSTAGTPIHRLLMDPYILIASGTVMVTTMSMATLEPTVPIWILDTMHAQKWQLGLVFLPDSIGYFVGTNFFGVITKKVGRWICSLSCMLLIGLCLTCIPFATSVTQLILPHFGLGLGLGITDSAIMPLLALLVDTRHVAAYGSVYSIVQLAVCLAYGLGPSVAGQIVKAVGFSWLIWGLAILNVGYSPFCWFLKNPYVAEENKPILNTEDDAHTEY